MATVLSRIGPADHGRRMTIAEFLQAEEEPGYRYELARGVVEVSEVPNDPHGQVVCNLSLIVALYHHAHPGMILRFGGGGEFQLIINEYGSGRNPDFTIVLQGAPKDDRGRRVPVLAAEVVSEDSVDRDYRVKAEEYLAFGLREYWIIDLKLRKLTVLVRDDDNWIARDCPDDRPIPSLVLDGPTATPADLWVNLDRYD